VASPNETTEYFATYTSPLGCSVSDSLFVRVFNELPNTITPDNDGVNDVWNIPGINEYPNVAVAIFNRWGNEIFSSRGYSEPWDGRRDGKDLPAGSYFYIIDYKQDGKENLNGTVNIIR
jgi:gliding motility-associated-like protein